MKTFLYRIFGIGKIREPLLSRLKQEGILFLEEGIGCSITYLDFRSPGRRSDWRRQWFTGSIALTNERLILLKYSSPFINVSSTDERIDKLHLSHEETGKLLIAFDAGLFLDNSSGKIECRFRTTKAQFYTDILRKQAA